MIYKWFHVLITKQFSAQIFIINILILTSFLRYVISTELILVLDCNNKLLSY